MDGAAASVTTVAAAAEALTDDIVGCFTSIATSDVVARTIRGDLATLASVPVSRSLSSPLLSKRWVPLSVMCTLPRFGDGTGDASSTRTFTASSAPSSTVVGCTVPAICGAAGRFPAAYASFPRRAARRFAAFFALPPSTPSVFGGAVAARRKARPLLRFCSETQPRLSARRRKHTGACFSRRWIFSPSSECARSVMRYGLDARVRAPTFAEERSGSARSGSEPRAQAKAASTQTSLDASNIPKGRDVILAK